MDAYLSNSDPSRLVITVRGEVDLATSGELLERLLVLTHQAAEPVAIDLSQVTFMDCAGLHVLAKIDRRIRSRGGAMRVLATSAAVARLFELAGSLTAPPAYPVPDTPRPVPAATATATTTS